MRLWDVKTKNELYAFGEQEHSLSGVSFINKEKYAIAGVNSYKKDTAYFLSLWDIASGKRLRSFGGQTNGVKSLAVSPDARSFVTGNGDGAVRLWDIERDQELYRFDGHKDPYVCVAYSPNGQFILSGSSDSTVRVWRLPRQP